MRSVEQIAGRLDVTCGESIHELVHTADFGDDVTYTLLHGFIFQLAKHLRQCGIRIGRGGNGFGGNAQIGDAENLGGLLAGGASLRILAIVKLMRGAGVEYE